MKKLTKKEKARYPEFVVYVDATAQCSKEKGLSFYYKPMEEKDLIEVMQVIEGDIRTHPGYIYIAEIMQKTTIETVDGQPFYQSR